MGVPLWSPQRPPPSIPPLKGEGSQNPKSRPTPIRAPRVTLGLDPRALHLAGPIHPDGTRLRSSLPPRPPHPPDRTSPLMELRPVSLRRQIAPVARFEGRRQRNLYSSSIPSVRMGGVNAATKPAPPRPPEAALADPSGPVTPLTCCRPTLPTTIGYYRISYSLYETSIIVARRYMPSLCFYDI